MAIFSSHLGGESNMNGARVLAIIKERGVKVTKINEVLGINKTTFYNKVNGKSEFKASEINKIAAFLNIPVSEFYTDKGNY